MGLDSKLVLPHICHMTLGTYPFWVCFLRYNNINTHINMNLNRVILKNINAVRYLKQPSFVYCPLSFLCPYTESKYILCCNFHPQISWSISSNIYSSNVLNSSNVPRSIYWLFPLYFRQDFRITHHSDLFPMGIPPGCHTIKMIATTGCTLW